MEVLRFRRLNCAVDKNANLFITGTNEASIYWIKISMKISITYQFNYNRDYKTKSERISEQDLSHEWSLNLKYCSIELIAFYG